MILVLWGYGFDEIAASIFVAELRRAGKRVKLVGLNSQQIAGQHGVILFPDLLLGQALRAANRIQCIIVPAPLAALKQFSHDPRLAELLGLATSQNALVVANASPAVEHDLSHTSLPVFPLHRLLPYPSPEELMGFVQNVLVPRLMGGT